MGIRNMTLWLAGILLAVLGSLSGCGGGGTSTPACSAPGGCGGGVIAADVIGSWKMVSYTAPGASAVNMSAYNISLVSDASTYTIVFPVAIPGGHPVCTEYGTWSVSSNSLTTTPLAGSTCGNSASTQALSISGTTMTTVDATGTYVYQKQAPSPITGNALVGSWKTIASNATGPMTPVNFNLTLDLLATNNFTLTGTCTKTGTWSASGSSSLVLNIATNNCANSSNLPLYELVSLNSPLMTMTEGQLITIWTRLPDAPMSLVATGTTGGISLSWQAVNGATSYKVYRATTSGAFATKTAIGSTASTTYQDTSAVAGTTYYYQVTAVSAVGESLPSIEVNGVATAPPSPVTGLTATAGTGQETLSWTAVSGATSYNIYFKTANIGMCVFTAPNMGTGDYSLTGWTRVVGTFTSPAATLTGTTGTCYSFMVTAVNVYGESLSMHYVDVTPL